ncbi:hypothetical protein GR268_45500, partial [Rhizobium leguminosarum]|nr:hypothetical protein [Rhizobium leguminosarum]
EKKPLLVKRKERKVGDGNRLTKDLFSFATFERLFSSNRPLFYTKNLNVCRYEDGEKKMLNPEGSTLTTLPAIAIKPSILLTLTRLVQRCSRSGFTQGGAQVLA